MSKIIDRRTFLKFMGGAGATAAYVSAAPPAFGARSFSESEAPLGQTHVIAGDVLAKLPKEKLASIYQKMVTNRKWETTIKDLYMGAKDGLYGYFHMYIGEEGVANGVMAALNEDDYIVSTHRGHGHLIAKGGDLNKMSAEIYLKATGYNQGYGGSMHITDMSKGIMGTNGIVGASWLIAAGAAWSAQIRGTKQVGVAFGGDGATNSIFYFDAIRNAALYKLPFIAVVENNHYNSSTPYRIVTPVEHICDYCQGLKIPGVHVDGNDVAEVYAATQEAVERARAGEGPSVIEAMTYRWYDHNGFAGAKIGVDGAFGLPYRPDDEVRLWMSRDPIPRFAAFLVGRQLFSEDELSKIDADVQTAIDASIEFARESPVPEPQMGLKNVWAHGDVVPTQFFDREKSLAWADPAGYDSVAWSSTYPEA